MARVAGRNLRLYAGIASDTASAEPIAFMSKWTASFETDDFDVTAGGDTNKVYVSGLPDASGTFNGFWDSATAQLYTGATDGLARRFYLYPTTPANTGPYWFGTALFDWSVEADVGGAISVSGSWKAASPFTRIG
jgi:hypothetical protein